MRRFIFVSLLLALGAFPAAAHADGPSHIVAYGETLYSIARMYGVTPYDLATANGISTDSWVYAGQQLIIPGAGEATGSPANPLQAAPGTTYSVQAGDTLSSLSRRFGISVSALADANNIPPNGFLYTGWQLVIPGGASSPPPQASASASNPSEPKASETNSTASTTYIVKPGDTLYAIALRFGVSAQAIRDANQLATLLVYSNQRLVIPAAAPGAPQQDNPQTTNRAPAPRKSTELRVAGIPVFRQKQTLTCEEAAAAMATRGELSEAEIVAAMPRSDNPFEGIRGETNYSLYGGLTHYGTYAQGLQKALTKLGRPSTAYYGQSYAQFKAMILDNLKQGRPVIWWTTWRESYQRPQTVQVSSGISVELVPYEHSVVIVAADEQGVTYHDPYDGSVRTTSWANHQRTSSYFHNMALVVY